jgi:hypothetical protein
MLTLTENLRAVLNHSFPDRWWEVQVQVNRYRYVVDVLQDNQRCITLTFSTELVQDVPITAPVIIMDAVIQTIAEKLQVQPKPLEPFWNRN